MDSNNLTVKVSYLEYPGDEFNSIGCSVETNYVLTEVNQRINIANLNKQNVVVIDKFNNRLTIRNIISTEDVSTPVIILQTFTPVSSTTFNLPIFWLTTAPALYVLNEDGTSTICNLNMPTVDQHRNHLTFSASATSVMKPGLPVFAEIDGKRTLFALCSKLENATRQTISVITLMSTAFLQHFTSKIKSLYAAQEFPDDLRKWIEENLIFIEAESKGKKLTYLGLAVGNFAWAVKTEENYININEMTVRSMAGMRYIIIYSYILESYQQRDIIALNNLSINTKSAAPYFTVADNMKYPALHLYLDIEHGLQYKEVALDLVEDFLVTNPGALIVVQNDSGSFGLLPGLKANRDIVEGNKSKYNFIHESRIFQDYEKSTNERWDKVLQIESMSPSDAVLNNTVSLFNGESFGIAISHTAVLTILDGNLKLVLQPDNRVLTIDSKPITIRKILQYNGTTLVVLITNEDIRWTYYQMFPINIWECKNYVVARRIYTPSNIPKCSFATIHFEYTTTIPISATCSYPCTESKTGMPVVSKVNRNFKLVGVVENVSNTQFSFFDITSPKVKRFIEHSLLLSEKKNNPTPDDVFMIDYSIPQDSGKRITV